jgi:hypothetical protein
MTTVEPFGGAIVRVVTIAGGVMVKTVGTGIARSEAGAACDSAAAVVALITDNVTVAVASWEAAGPRDCAAEEEVEAAELLGATSGNVSPLLGAGAAKTEVGAGWAAAAVSEEGAATAEEVSGAAAAGASVAVVIAAVEPIVVFLRSVTVIIRVVKTVVTGCC